MVRERRQRPLPPTVRRLVPGWPAPGATNPLASGDRCFRNRFLRGGRRGGIRVLLTRDACGFDLSGLMDLHQRMSGGFQRSVRRQGLAVVLFGLGEVPGLGAQVGDVGIGAGFADRPLEVRQRFVVSALPTGNQGHVVQGRLCSGWLRKVS